jgi:predicted nuclease of restriction endonuclease-like (RecB) superfamily
MGNAQCGGVTAKAADLDNRSKNVFGERFLLEESRQGWEKETVDRMNVAHDIDKPSAPRAYADWIQEVSRRYRRSQIKAAVAVNAEMLKFYFGIGRDIALMEPDQPWGSGFLKRVSADLKAKMPDAGCFSPTNLKYMHYFWRLYSPCLSRPQVGDGSVAGIRPQLGDKLETGAGEPVFRPGDPAVPPIFRVPWGHHKLLIDKFASAPETALFYVRETVKNGWSRAVLLNFLDTNLHERQGKAVTNFAVALPEPDSDLAQEVTKDPYCFDFAALAPKYREKELKDAMMAHIERFLLELGQGFMLVGREYRLEIGAKEKFADLLFFHMELNRYVVVEVKAADFEPEHLGQLGLYVSAVNHLLKKPAHGPTIGLLVCKTKDNTMVKWALEATQQPIGVSEYRVSEILPQDVAGTLPTIEEIETGIALP